MKKSLIYVMEVCAAAMCLMVSAAEADQQAVTVPDAGFDDHVLDNVGDWIYISDTGYTGAWKSHAVNQAWIDYGYYADDPEGPDLPALSGNNKAYGNDDGTEDYIYQILDETFIEGKMYTFSVWVGLAWSGYDDGWSLYFTGEDYTNNLIEKSGNGPVGSWGLASVAYTATAADAGKKIGIKMKGDTYVTFEDVALSYGPPQARDPDPADGALVMNTWVTLSWTPGTPALSHDVYLADDFDSINDGTRDSDVYRGNQTSTFYVAGFPGFAYPDGLVPGTTYYWRIDEVEPDGTTIYKGDVWSFSIPPRTAYNPDPAEGTELVDPNAPTLSWMPGYGAKLHTVYLGDDFDEVSDATGGMTQGAATYSPGPLELEKVYYWRVDEFDAVTTYKGDVWTFTTPGAVGNPQPACDATDMQLNVILSWTLADSAASHQLYLGTDKAAVRNADTGVPEYKGSFALGAESHDPGLLDAETTYYWRVDEVDAQGNTMKGPVWIFTTGTFLLVDDFESYTDDDVAGEAIWQTWIDGFGVADNGAQVGNLMPPYCEQTIVHGGGQSMPILYVNEAGVTNSEGTLPLTALQDWTQASVAELSLWFRGASINAAEPMYMSASNAAGVPAVVAHNDLNAAQINRWTQWIIPLQALADQGITLTNVDKFAIGLGSKSGMAAVGGTGTVYIDDIRLYRP